MLKVMSLDTQYATELHDSGVVRMDDVRMTGYLNTPSIKNLQLESHKRAANSSATRTL